MERRSGADRRRGRPPLAEDSSQLSVRLPADLHDRLFAAAAAREEAVSVTLRRMLHFALSADALFRTPKL